MQNPGRAPPKRPDAERYAHAPGTAASGSGPAAAKPVRRQSSPASKKEKPKAERSKQAAVTARTERLRSALQQLRSKKSLKQGELAGGTGDCSGRAGATASAKTAATAPQEVGACQPDRSSPRHSHAPPELQHPAAYCRPLLGADPDPDPELDSSLEDLLDEASLRLLERLQLGRTRPDGKPHKAYRSRQGMALDCSCGPSTQQTTQVHSDARQALQDAAEDEELPQQHGLDIAAKAARHCLSPERQPASAAEVQRRLERLRCGLRTPCTPVQSCNASGGPSSPPGPHRESRASGALDRQAPPCRLAAGELVLTRSPHSGAAAAEAHCAGAGGYSAGLQSKLAALRRSSPNRGGAAGGMAVDVSWNRSAAARLAALLGTPLERQPAATVRHSVGCVGSAQLQHAPLLSSQPCRGAAADSSARAEQPASMLQATHAAQGAATGALLPPTASVQALAGAAAGAEGRQVLPVRPTAGAGMGGGGGDILEAWRSRRRAAQAQPLADKYARFLLLQQGGQLQQLQQHQHQGSPQEQRAAAAVGAAPEQHGVLAVLQQAAGLPCPTQRPQHWPEMAISRPHWGSTQLALPSSNPANRKPGAGAAVCGSDVAPARPALGPTSQQPSQQRSLATRKQQALAPLQPGLAQAPAPDQAAGGDILERWRARRRQQSGQGDYAALLTLRPPVASPAGDAAQHLQAHVGAGTWPAPPAAASAAAPAPLQAAAAAQGAAELAAAKSAALTGATVSPLAAAAAEQALPLNSPASDLLLRPAMPHVAPAVVADAAPTNGTKTDGAVPSSSATGSGCTASSSSLAQGRSATTAEPVAAAAAGEVAEAGVAEASSSAASLVASAPAMPLDSAGGGHPIEDGGTGNDAEEAGAEASAEPTAVSTCCSSRPPSAGSSSGRATPRPGWSLGSPSLRRRWAL